MPHDALGTLLKDGDLVNVPCVAVHVYAGQEYCNVALETVQPMFPGTNKSSISLNAKQVYAVDATRDFGSMAYEAYRCHTGGKSLATGQDIPAWNDLRPDIQEAWCVAAGAILSCAYPLAVVEG